ncbi:hypothetical protein BJV74DRAFT_831601 [Russula compacta]|nr:hypothetical protein BJV74DRAFT_831601 [Russula compacta]
MGALNESLDPCSQTEESWYHPPHTGEPEPFSPILFPTPTPILARTWSVESSTSLEPETTLSGPSDDLRHSLNREEGDHDAQFSVAMCDAKDKRSNVRGCTRGPNRRRPGTGYSDLMDKLPKEVQDALNRNYRDCCEVVVKKDNSTMQKHRFSNRHCSNLPQELQELLPTFTCPAFVAMNSSCRSAKAGRYDSTERHCQNCPGFKELNTAGQMYPMELTKGEFKAVRDYRRSAHPSQAQGTYPLLVQNASMKVLAMILRLEPSSLLVYNPIYMSDSIGNASATDIVADERPSFTSWDEGDRYGRHFSGSNIWFA